MKQLKNNWGIIVSFVLTIIFLIYIGADYQNKTNSLQEFSKNIFYMDTYINIKIYTNDKNDAAKALREVEKIYKEYHELTDRYNEYNNLINIYTINNHIKEDEKLTIDSKLYDLIYYSKNVYNQTNGLFNINLGNVIDVWKKYRDNKNGIPEIEELKKSGSINIDDIVLLSDNQILNNKPNIDLGAIAKGYTTEKAANYLKSISLNQFIINAGGNVIFGDHYDNDKYKIGIEDPTNPGSVYQIIVANNMSITTSGSYQRFYEYNGNIYHHIIDPYTLYPSNHMKSVTIITPDGALGEVLSTTLFLMSVDEGIEYLKNYESVEAIWYTVDNKIIKTEGFNKYEQE